jgi:proteasome lid subunit RPN8/RPN11
MYDEILAHTREGGAEEVCGLIAGQNGRPVRLFRIQNTAENPTRRYYMEPHAQLRVLRELEEQGWELLAIYHSHPASENYPSRTDVAEAFYPEAYYIISTLSDAAPTPVRAYRIVDGVITEEEVKVEEEG